MHGLLLLIGAAILWSSGGVLIKLVDASPMAVSSGRSIIAALTLMALTRRVPVRPTGPVLLCALFYGLTIMTFVIATKLTTAANAIVLQYAAPVYVALFSAKFLGEKISKNDWICIGVVMVGMILFFADGLSAGSNLGNMVGIFSGFCFAGMVVSLRRIHDQNPADAIIIGNLFAFVCGVPWLIEADLNGVSLLGIVLLGVFQLGVAYFLYTKAIAHVSALEAVLIPILEPLLNPVWVYLMMGEVPGSWALVGALVIIGAVSWRSITGRRMSTS